jgi:hypothetical protein
VKHLLAFIDLGPLDTLLNDPLKRRLLLFAAGIIGLAVILGLLRQAVKWMRRPDEAPPTDRSLIIDLGALPIAEPGATRLTVYHVPVRLAVVVIAPLGRDSTAPKHSDVPKLLDHIVPGLGSVMAHDQTIVKIWPQQLSATGFAPTLMRHVQLPGDRGRETPWCLVTGRSSFGGASFAIGLALAAAAPNNLGLIAVESEHQWLDVLRMRSA